MALVKKENVADEDNQIIKPEQISPNVNTSDWPLLLKNWDQRKCYPSAVEFRIH
jgi:H/ACA ribonucleoprotein complex subunit 4